MSTDLTDDELIAMWNAESVPERSTSHFVRAFARAAIAADRTRRASSAAAVPAEPMGYAQLGALNGKTYLRTVYDRTPYPPPADVARNLNLVPVFANPAPPQAVPEKRCPWPDCPHGSECVHATATPQAVPATVTMADAVAAGDGTLHGAIDHWQERALTAEAETQRLRDELALCCELKREYQERAAVSAQAVPATDAEAVPHEEMAGLSWDGFDIHGTVSSIREVQRLIHEAGRAKELAAYLASRSPAAPVAVDADPELPPLPDFAHAFQPRWPGDPGGFCEVQMQAYARSALRAVGAGSRDKEDAERYRWLRKTTNTVTNSSGERVDVRNNPELWDAAIDAARGKA